MNVAIKAHNKEAMKKEFTKHFTAALTMVLALIALSAGAQYGVLDQQYYKGQGVDYKCTGGLVLPDSSVIVTGKFAYVNQTRINGIVKLLPDGSVDNSFNVGTGANDHVNVVIRQPDGKLVIGGDFTTFNGVTVNRIARLNTDGSLDAGFTSGGGFNNSIYTLYLQADGKIVAGGAFTMFNSATAGRIIRLNADGTRDNTFTCVPGAGAAVYAIDRMQGGDYIVGGDFGTINGRGATRIARIDATGIVNATFNSGYGANGTITSALVLPNDQIVIAGYFTLVDSVSSPRIARLQANGARDASFAVTSGFNSNVNELALQPDGKIIAVGAFTSYNSSGIKRIARLESNGTKDATFKIGGGADLSLNAVFLNADGKIYVGGTFTSIDSFARLRIARLQSNGAVDQGFLTNSRFNNQVSAIGYQSNGLAIVAGSMITNNNQAIGRIARLDVNGDVDLSFNAGGSGANGAIRALVVQADDKIVIAGDFTKYNNTTCNRICRLNANGTLDATYTIGSGLNASAYAMALQTDGKVILTGNFSTYSGSTVGRLLRLNTNGTIDASFNTGTGLDNLGMELALQPDGKILVGGNFNNYDGSAAGKLLRLNINGSADNTFNTGTGANNVVSAISIQPDGKIVAGGSFTLFNGVSHTRLVRLNVDGSTDASYAATANAPILDLLAIRDGMLAVGQFSTLNGVLRNRIVYLDQAGRIDTVNYNYIKGTGTGNIAKAQYNSVERRIWLGGSFTDFEGVLSNKLARVNASNLEILWPAEDLCPGAQVYIGAKTVGNLISGNIYKIQLSDSNGFFNNPVTVGAKSSTATTDSVLVSIPANTPAGNNYRLRIVSTAASDTSFCSSTFSIQALPVPPVNVSGATTFCSGGSVTLACQGGLAYLWSNGATSASLQANASGSYVVTATYAYGCQAVSAPVSVTVHAAPDSSIAIAAVNLCANTMQLQAAPGLSYQWSSGATTQSIAVSTAGTFTVQLTNSFGCKSDSSITVNPASLSSNLISSNGPTALCPGQSVILSSVPNLTYVWSNNQTTQSITVSSAGNYAVTVTDGSCSATSTIVTVTTNNAPVANITAPVTQLCAGATTQLSAPAGLSYQWSTGQTTSSINVNAAGTYSVTVVDNNNCTAADSKSISIAPALNNSVTTNGSTTICQGTSLQLSAAPGLIYLWSTGATTQTISAANSGSYSVTVTNAGTNCTAESTPVVVTVKSAPIASISATATAICPAALTTLSGPANVSYLWSTGASTSSLVVGPGTYRLTVTDGNNCTASATQVIAALNGPDTTVSISGATDICDGETITISAGSGSGFSYSWSNGFGSQSITVSTAGTYRATVSDAISHCMAVTSPVTVTIKPVPAINYSLPADRVCNTAGIIQLNNASPAGGTFFVNGWVATEVDPSQYSNSNVVVTYVYEATNGCEAYKADTVFVETCTSISDVTGDNITVYPNPARNYIVIADAQNNLTRIDVVNMLGQTLLTETTTAPQGQVSLNISQLATGNYFIVTNNKKFKFMKAE